MTGDKSVPTTGLLHTALDEFLGRARAVADLVGSVGSGAVGAVPSLIPDSVARMLTALQQLVDLVPQMTTEVDVLMETVHAKRLTLQALQAELAAFDSQLGLLEKSLSPLKTWTDQWSRVQGSLTDTLGTVRASNPPEK